MFNNIDKMVKVAPIGRLLKADPNNILVGKVREGPFSHRDTFVEIIDGRLVGIIHLSYGILGERGRSLIPPYITAEQAPEYFSQSGVPDEVIQATIIPAIHARKLYNQQRAARQENP